MLAHVLYALYATSALTKRQRELLQLLISGDELAVRATLTTLIPPSCVVIKFCC